MIDYLKIEGYKSIKSAKIELRPINLFIGANGSGKSNFLSFFELLNQLTNENLRFYVLKNGGVAKFLHHGQKVTNQIRFEISFENERNAHCVVLENGTNNQFIFAEENLIYQKKAGQIFTDGEETRLKKTDDFRAKYIIEELNNLKKYHFHDTGKNSPLSKMSHIRNDSVVFYSDGSNIAAFLYQIFQKNKSVYRNIVHTIQSIAPYFLDFVFRPQEDQIQLLWQDRFSENTYGVTDFSDGTLRFIALTVLFMQPNLPKTLVIDEPELGLHPTAIAKLSGMIKSAAQKKCQVLVATQSTDLISHFTPEDIVAVDQRNGESSFKRLDTPSLQMWLDDYTIDDLWKRRIIEAGHLNF